MSAADWLRQMKAGAQLDLAFLSSPDLSPRNDAAHSQGGFSHLS